MTIVLTLLAKDEIDIIRDVIEYHLFQGISHIILTDNGSSDGTREVVEEFCRKGVLTLIDEPGDDFSQAQWVTRMARRAATEFKADWVINSNADEFWWPGNTSLSAILSKLPPRVGAGNVRRVNFLPSLSQEGHFLPRMIWRETESLDPLGRFPLPPKIVHRGDPAINIEQGNHTATGPSLGEVLLLNDLEIFHFPVRSYKQLYQKVLNRGAACERNKKATQEQGHAMRYLYQQLKEGRLQEYWDSLPKADGTCREGVVKDTRLSEYLAEKRKKVNRFGALKKRIVVVLGMHRSGTSAITRALKVMGIDLGDHLMRGIPDNNEKGFWEDLDFNKLNVELLEFLSCHWDALAVPAKNELKKEEIAPFRMKAIELLREKTRFSDIFAMKDPRLTRILPFWQDVFAHCGFEASYVIAIRNPMSVSRSLSARNQFIEEKAHYLWLAHVLPSVLETANCPRVIVDYDRLMDQPDAEIRRMARALNLMNKVDPGELAKYKRDFLEERLRHARHAPEELDSNPAVPSLVVKTFGLLAKTALDEPSIDAPEVQTFFKEISEHFKELSPALRYMTRQDEIIVNRNSQIAALGRVLAARDKRIVALDESISEFKNMIRERDKQIGAFEHTLSEREEQVRTLQEVYLSEAWKVLTQIRRVIPVWARNFVFCIYQILSYRIFSERLRLKRSGFFDAEWYLAKYPDVAKAGWDPLEHYLKRGGMEGRSPGPNFDGDYYLRGYPDVFRKGMNPLLHYLQFGKDEGRRPLPSENISESTVDAVQGSMPLVLAVKAKDDSLFASIARQGVFLIQKLIFRIVFKAWGCAWNFKLKWNKIKEEYSNGLEEEVPDVSILIPTYGNFVNVERCLKSMLVYPPQVTYEVLIINDHPARRKEFRERIESARALLNRFQCRIFSSSKNIGFAPSINALSRSARGTNLFLLNDDTEICSPRWLDALVNALRSDAVIGAVGSLLLFPQSNLVNHAGLYPVLRKDGKIWNGCFYKHFNRKFSGVNVQREVPMLTGAALLISRKCFREAGTLDEKYQGAGGFDDSDLSNRLRERGYKLVYVPESVIVHHEGKTTQAISSHREQLFMNQRYYAGKWASFLRQRYNL